MSLWVVGGGQLRGCRSDEREREREAGHALTRASHRASPQVRAPLEKKLGEDPGFMGALAADIAQLAAELAALGVAENGGA